MTFNPKLKSIDSWLRLNDYLVYRLRAMLPGTAQAGTVDATASAIVTGTGTDFTTLKVNNWVTFASLPGRTFQIVNVDSATQITINEAITVVADTLSLVTTRVFDQVRPQKQPDVYVLCLIRDANIDRFPENRDFKFQCIVQSRTDGEAQSLAIEVRKVFAENYDFDLEPPLTYETLRVTTMKIRSYIPLGDVAKGRFQYSLNFDLEGGE